MDPTRPEGLASPAQQNPAVAGRVRYLDVLRGVALLGILPVNMPLFALPVTAASEPAWVTGGALREQVAFHATRFVFEMKFVTLFSLLFGVGMMIQRLRGEPAGRPYVPLMVRRLGALFLFGFAHVVFFWFGDILTYYAILGLTCFWLGFLPPRTLFRVGTAAICMPIALLVVLSSLAFLLQDTAPFAPIAQSLMETGGEEFVPGSTLGSFPEFVASLEHFGPAFESEVFGEGGFWRIALVRVMTWLFAAVVLGFDFGLRIVGLFLVGMAWAKDGWFLDPAANRMRFRRMLAIGLAVGVPVQFMALAVDLSSDSLGGAILSHLLLHVGSLGIAAAYAAMVALAFGGAWSRPFESVGRIAFSNYILQSLLATTLFYSYGFALFGRLDRVQLWLVVLAIWVLQLVASPLWTRRFRFGPLEWLWRFATYAGNTDAAAPRSRL